MGGGGRIGDVGKKEIKIEQRRRKGKDRATGEIVRKEMKKCIQ
jgi:hypothetical protein